MFDEAPETLRQIYEGDWDSPDALVEFELSICGISHCELGQMALAGGDQDDDCGVRAHLHRSRNRLSATMGG